MSHTEEEVKAKPCYSVAICEQHPVTVRIKH